MKIINERELREITTDLIFDMQKVGFEQAISDLEKIIFNRPLTEPQKTFYYNFFTAMKILNRFDPSIFTINQYLWGRSSKLGCTLAGATFVVMTAISIASGGSGATIFAGALFRMGATLYACFGDEFIAENYQNNDLHYSID